MATITIQLNDAEQDAFHQLLDIALRNTGMNAFNAVSHFVALLNFAAKSSPVQAAPVQFAPGAKIQQAPQTLAAADAPSAPHAAPQSTAPQHAAAQAQTASGGHTGILGAIEHVLGVGGTHTARSAADVNSNEVHAQAPAPATPAVVGLAAAPSAQVAAPAPSPATSAPVSPAAVTPAVLPAATAVTAASPTTPVTAQAS